MLQKLFIKYKTFEKYFFKADKAEDMIDYIKLKHQFRTMMAYSAFMSLLFLFVLIKYGFALVFAFIVPLLFLVTFRTKAYRSLYVFLFIAMSWVPCRYPDVPSLVLLTPAVILFINLQMLIHSQSVNLTMAHLSFQGFWFYFYGIDKMIATIKGLSSEELVECAKNAIICTFLCGLVNLLCLKIYGSQFSSLLRKINTLKDDLAKANNQLNEKNLKLRNNLEMKDVFIYTFSHELKNALNGPPG